MCDSVAGVQIMRNIKIAHDNVVCNCTERITFLQLYGL